MSLASGLSEISGILVNAVESLVTKILISDSISPASDRLERGMGLP